MSRERERRKERVLSREKGGFGLESSKRENNKTKRKYKGKTKTKTKGNSNVKKNTKREDFLGGYKCVLSHPIVGGVKKKKRGRKKNKRKRKTKAREKKPPKNPSTVSQPLSLPPTTTTIAPPLSRTSPKVNQTPFLSFLFFP